MKKAFLALLLTAFTLNANATSLFLFGGGTRSAEALQKFVQLAGGAQANILVITWATTVPEESFTDVATDLKNAGATQIIASGTIPTSPQNKTEFLTQLKSANAVFFTGGDQNRALDVIDAADLRGDLKNAFRSGVIFAGTSAGTALMPEIAMTGDADLQTISPNNSPTRPGLGLVSQLVDQHFIKRQRMNRLISLSMSYPDRGAIGIDQDTCLFIQDSIGEVFGPTEVVFMKNSSEAQTSFQLHILSQHQKFDLLSFQPIP